MRLDRRGLLGTLALGTLAACAPPRDNYRRGGVLALDWALAETAIVLGTDPAGVIAVSDWSRFVIEPALPAGVADLGLQQELNFELMAALRPRLFLISPFLDRVKPDLDRIAPSVNLSVYEPPEAPLSHRMALTRELAEHLDAAPACELYLRQLEVLGERLRHQLGALERKPVLMVSFVDNRHARVYGGSSLYADTMAWLGLENAWTEPVGFYGFGTVGIEQLASLRDIELVAVEPVPPDIERALDSSPLWRELPLVKAGQVGRIPPAFMFGALPSARRFALLLVDHLTRKWT